MNEKLRKVTLASMGIYGEEPNLEIKGVFLFRGTEIPLWMEEHPQLEYYKPKKLDPKKEEDVKLAVEYFCKREGDSAEGQKVQTQVYYK